MSELEELLQDSDFAAMYFELLYHQHRIALENACRKSGPVACGMVTLQDEVMRYLGDAVASEEYEELIYSTQKPPVSTELFTRLMEHVRKYEADYLSRRCSEETNESSTDL